MKNYLISMIFFFDKNIELNIYQQLNAKNCIKIDLLFNCHILEKIGNMGEDVSARDIMFAL